MSHGLIGPITLKGWETSREIAIPAARPAAPGKGLLRYLLFLHFERQGPGLLQPSYQITHTIYFSFKPHLFLGNGSEIHPQLILDCASRSTGPGGDISPLELAGRPKPATSRNPGLKAGGDLFILEYCINVI